MQLLGVLREEAVERKIAQHRQASRREFVDDDFAHAGDLGEDRQPADPCGRLDVGVIGLEIGDPVGEEGVRRRRRELLKLILLGGSLGLRGDLLQQRVEVGDRLARRTCVVGRIEHVAVIEQVLVDAKFHRVVRILDRVHPVGLRPAEVQIGHAE